MRKKAYSDAELTQIVESVSNCKFIETYARQSRTRKVRMLKLRCKCGEVFHTSWDNFNKKSRPPKRQCNSCGESVKLEKLREFGEQNRLTNAEYEQRKAEKGITIVTAEEYAGYDVKIKHVCPKCFGDWVTTPAVILGGAKTCQKCQAQSLANAMKNPLEKVRENLAMAGVKWVSGEYTTYETSIFKLECSCGKLFTRNYRDVMTGSNRCYYCVKKVSYGEFAIIEWLEDNEYDFVFQQKFPDLKSDKGYPLSYDFGIKDGGAVKILVEYDGEHHHRPLYSFYKTTKEAEDAFLDSQRRDSIKTTYANANGILLVRLIGDDFKNLEAKLGEHLKTIKQYANTEVSENITRHRNA